jgi:hypothetical protein
MLIAKNEYLVAREDIELQDSTNERQGDIVELKKKFRFFSFGPNLINVLGAYLVAELHLLD